MGGQQDMGPVEYKKNEPVFHAPWEGAVYALPPCDARLGPSGTSMPTGMRSS